MSETTQPCSEISQREKLAKLAGNWKGLAKVWFEPGEPVDTSKAEGTIRPVMGGKWMLFEYKGSFQGKPLEGLAILGFHNALKRFEFAWIDSFHTYPGIMFSEGQRDVDRFSALGSYAYVTPETEQHWGWRTEFELQNDNSLVVTAYNISPEGEESLATQAVYKRQS